MSREKLKALWDQGLTNDQIMDEANRLGIKTPTGRKWKKQNLAFYLRQNFGMKRKGGETAPDMDFKAFVADILASNLKAETKLHLIKKELGI